MKNSRKRLKRALTLIEIMVVIMLITMITGAVAYNYSKSIDKGRDFKTKEIKARVEAILNMSLADGTLKQNEFEQNWKSTVNSSAMVRAGSDFTKDGHGRDIVAHIDADGNVKVD